MPNLLRFKLIALLLGVGIGCAALPPQPLAAQTLHPNERLVTSASGSFSAVFPDQGWQIIERLPHALKLEPGDRPLSLMATADYLAADDQAQPIAELLKANVQRQLGDKISWRITEQTPAVLGDAPARRLEATALIGQTPVTLILLGRKVGERLCAFQLTGTPSLTALGMPIFERAVESFRCTPPADDALPRRASAKTLATEAQRSIEALDPSRGAALLALAVKREPQDPGLLEKLVQAQLLAGDVPRAIRTLKAELSRNPDRFEHWRLLAQIQYQLGDAEGGLSTLKSAASRPGVSAGLLATLGEAYLREDRFGDAEAILKSAIAREPANVEALSALGEVYLHEKKLDLAESIEKQAIAIDPGRGELHAALSEVYGQENRDDLASQECVEALERDVPKSLEATLKYNLACFSARLGRERECLFWLRQALEAGFNDVEFMRKDPDLASVRGLPAFRELFEQP
jgi:tetratricopeptide (TPR) repeat protein